MRIRLIRVVAAALLVLGCGAAPVPGTHPLPTTHRPSPSPAPATSAAAPGSLLVAGRTVGADGLRSVADALAAAGVTPRDGRLLAVVSRTVLDPHAAPAVVHVNGRVATSTTPVHAGDVVTIVDGRDAVEPTRVVRVQVALPPAARRLYRSVTPGYGDATVGSRSGEQVSLRLVHAPTVGRLVTAASAVLSFDDGPDAATAGVLSALTDNGVRAVFCLVGRQVQRHPELARAEVAAGMVLCDHTQTHPLNLPSLTDARIAAEVVDGAATIARVTGARPTLFRAPGGNWSAEVLSAATDAHMTPLKWSVDPRDWSRPGTEQILLRVLTQLRPGGVVLLHDGGADQSQTVAAVRRLLPELVAAGWRLVLP